MEPDHQEEKEKERGRGDRSRSKSQITSSSWELYSSRSRSPSNSNSNSRSPSVLPSSASKLRFRSRSLSRSRERNAEDIEYEEQKEKEKPRKIKKNISDYFPVERKIKTRVPLPLELLPLVEQVVSVQARDLEGKFLTLEQVLQQEEEKELEEVKRRYRNFKDHIAEQNQKVQQMLQQDVISQDVRQMYEKRKMKMKMKTKRKRKRNSNDLSAKEIFEEILKGSEYFHLPSVGVLSKHRTHLEYPVSSFESYVEFRLQSSSRMEFLVEPHFKEWKITLGPITKTSYSQSNILYEWSWCLVQPDPCWGGTPLRPTFLDIWLDSLEKENGKGTTEMKKEKKERVSYWPPRRTREQTFGWEDSATTKEFRFQIHSPEDLKRTSKYRKGDSLMAVRLKVKMKEKYIHKTPSVQLFLLPFKHHLEIACSFSLPDFAPFLFKHDFNTLVFRLVPRSHTRLRLEVAYQTTHNLSVPFQQEKESLVERFLLRDSRDAWILKWDKFCDTLFTESLNLDDYHRFLFLEKEKIPDLPDHKFCLCYKDDVFYQAKIETFPTCFEVSFRAITYGVSNCRSKNLMLYEAWSKALVGEEIDFFQMHDEKYLFVAFTRKVFVFKLTTKPNKETLLSTSSLTLLASWTPEKEEEKGVNSATTWTYYELQISSSEPPTLYFFYSNQKTIFVANQEGKTVYKFKARFEINYIKIIDNSLFVVAEDKQVFKFSLKKIFESMYWNLPLTLCKNKRPAVVLVDP